MLTGIRFCGHCAVAQLKDRSSSSEFLHAPPHQSSSLFRNKINTLKPNLCLILRFQAYVVKSGVEGRLCQKEYLRGQTHGGASVPHAAPLLLLLCPHVPVCLRKKKYVRKGAFREEYKARVIHKSMDADHRFACSSWDRGLLMSCDSGAQNKPLFPSVREIGIMSVWRFELLPSHPAQRYDPL